MLTLRTIFMAVMGKRHRILLLPLISIISLTLTINFIFLRRVTLRSSLLHPTSSSSSSPTSLEFLGSPKFNPLSYYRHGVNRTTIKIKTSTLTSETLHHRPYRESNSVDDVMILRVPEALINCSISGQAQNEFHDDGPKMSLRGTFTIVSNLISGSRQVTSCDEALITLTTHGDFRYLDNLVPIVERWEGPVSLTLYAPGSDLEPTLRRILYMRECTSPLIREWVTFHIFGDTRWFGDPIQLWTKLENESRGSVSCYPVPPFGEHLNTQRKARGLLYPVNVARNVARQAAPTQYILASDIELYPSINLIPAFFKMLAQNQPFFTSRPRPYVFVLPIFEMEEGSDLPETKGQMVGLLKKNSAVTFHKFVCPECHTIPRYPQWLKQTARNDSLSIFFTAKRMNRYRFWEPIYIGTNSDPFYDERLSWEGLRDKMSQGYALCVLNYDFMILDNAFLVHRPGINRKKHITNANRAIRKQNRIIEKKVRKELSELYGTRRGCSL